MAKTETHLFIPTVTTHVDLNRHDLCGFTLCCNFQRIRELTTSRRLPEKLFIAMKALFSLSYVVAQQYVVV